MTFDEVIGDRVSIRIERKLQFLQLTVHVDFSEVFFVEPLPTMADGTTLATVGYAMTIHAVFRYGIFDILKYFGNASIRIYGYDLAFLPWVVVSFLSHFIETI